MSRWVCFNHGKESGPWGAKIQRLSSIAEANGYRVMSPDYRGIDSAEERLAVLLRALPDETEELVLVGSSMGGHVAAAAASIRQVDALFLMAPAVDLPGYETSHIRPRASRALVVHGWRDELVPVANVIGFCQRHCLALLLVESDHRLMSALDQIGEQFALLLNGCAEPDQAR